MGEGLLHIYKTETKVASVNMITCHLTGKAADRDPGSAPWRDTSSWTSQPPAVSAVLLGGRLEQLGLRQTAGKGKQEDTHQAGALQGLCRNLGCTFLLAGSSGCSGIFLGQLRTARTPQPVCHPLVFLLQLDSG